MIQVSGLFTSGGGERELLYATGSGVIGATVPLVVTGLAFKPVAVATKRPSYTVAESWLLVDGAVMPFGNSAGAGTFTDAGFSVRTSTGSGMSTAWTAIGYAP